MKLLKIKIKKLNENAFIEQLNRITQIFERKRINRDLSEWPAFAKEEFVFSQSNYYQYLLVDNTRYFNLQNAPIYPKKSARINAINRLFVLFEGFNRGATRF